MDKQKRRKLTSHVAHDYGMESIAVVTQMRWSILEPALAKFYRKYKSVSNHDEAYRVLNTENVTDMVVVEGASAVSNQFKNNRPASKGLDRVVLKESAFNRVLFSVDAKTPGFFAFSFPYSDAWNASLDGESTRIYRVNGYMQEVYVNPGQHKIEFRYWSKAPFVGMLISCLTLFLMGIYFAFFALEKKLKIGMKGNEMQVRKISPSLLRLSGWGMFKFEIRKGKGKNTVIVRNSGAKKGGKTRINFGYEFNYRIIPDKIVWEIKNKNIKRMNND